METENGGVVGGSVIESMVQSAIGQGAADPVCRLCGRARVGDGEHCLGHPVITARAVEVEPAVVQEEPSVIGRPPARRTATASFLDRLVAAIAESIDEDDIKDRVVEAVASEIHVDEGDIVESVIDDLHINEDQVIERVAEAVADHVAVSDVVEVAADKVIEDRRDVLDSVVEALVEHDAFIEAVTQAVVERLLAT